MRTARVQRETKETRVAVEVDLDGSGTAIEVPSGFFSHMLEALGRHAALGLRIEAQGDTHVDLHHTVEDLGIVLGQALKEAFGDKEGLARYGYAKLPMDESLVEVSLDISGRPFFVLHGDDVFHGQVGDLDLELVPEFFRALAINAGLTLHMTVCAYGNAHHLTEACFKAFAHALRRAKALTAEGILSTKDVL